MKSFFFILVLLVAGSTVSFAQCDKKVVLKSSKTEYLNADGVLENTVDDSPVLELDKSSVIILVDNGNKKMTGTIESSTCNWTTPFKEGKTTIHTILSDERGDPKDVTLTIEGKEGKVIVIAKAKERPNMVIRIVADKFEEKI